MLRLILFDLGNSLFFKKKPHLNYDIDLISLHTHARPDLIKKLIEKYSVLNPEIYDYSVNSKKSLLEEGRFDKNFFYKVFSELDKKDLLSQFLLDRKMQIRYELYKDSLNLLSLLSAKGYPLGILTNGRPSRRNIINLLKIDSFFEKKYVFISDEIGFSKPSQKAYQHVSNIVGHENITLCDDEEINIKSAIEFGWEGIEINHNSFGFSKVIKSFIN
jgi:HAD superfamily hydrolase (TIGR01549 family)